VTGVFLFGLPKRYQKTELIGVTEMDEIRDVGKTARKEYLPQEYFHFSKRITAKKNLVAFMLTELLGHHNEEVRHFWEP